MKAVQLQNDNSRKGSFERESGFRSDRWGRCARYRGSVNSKYFFYEKMSIWGKCENKNDNVSEEEATYHQAVHWQKAFCINMFQWCNKLPPRSSTLHTNFITSAMQERHLCMQMRTLSTLQSKPAKCIIMNVQCLGRSAHPGVRCS